MRFSRQEYWGFSGGPVVKNSPTRKHRFGSWSGKIPRAVEQLCPFTRTSEAWAPRAHAPEQKNHCTERPHTTRKSSPYWPQLEKSLCIAMKSLCTTSKRPPADKKKGGFFFFFLKCWVPGFCCKSSYIFWLLYLFRAVPQHHLRVLSPGLEVLKMFTK